MAGALWVVPSAWAQANTTTPSATITQYATMNSIGVEWPITGDANHNASVAVSYRVHNAPAWRAALPLVRMDYQPSSTLPAVNALNGSIFYLQPGVTYDVQLTLHDPDNGADVVRTLAQATRAIPTKPAGGTVLHVRPGSGGGNGSPAAPFLGINAAKSAAAPGVTFLLHAGNYGPSQNDFSTAGTPGSYIVWQAAGDGEVTFARVLISAGYQWFEGLTVRDNTTANMSAVTTANAPAGIVITRSQFLNNHYSIDINHGGSNWVITDNVFVGDVPASSDSLDGEGIELKRTSGHIIAYNSITNVADGVSACGVNCDIYGNDIHDVSDDLIEPDEGLANVRVFGNRLHNSHHNGLSFQPMNSGPWYFLRNQLVGFGEDALKFRWDTDLNHFDRIVFMHNTVVNTGLLFNVEADGMSFAVSRNNLWVSATDGRIWKISGASTDPFAFPFSWKTDLDYDGFFWGSAAPFKYLGTNHASVPAFTAATGQEAHGRAITRDTCFTSFNVPGPAPTPVPAQLMTLKAGCEAVDTGQVLPNINDGINDGFLGAAPDLGAYELGAALPQYGPRTARPVVWTDLVNVEPIDLWNNGIRKTTADGVDDAGALSQQAITSGSGYVELAPGQNGTYRNIGLGDHNPGTTRAEIRFAFHFKTTDLVEIRELGVWKASLSYAAGDVFRIAYDGTAHTVKFFQNGTLVYTSASAPVYPAYVDTSMWYAGSVLSNVVIAGPGI